MRRKKNTWLMLGLGLSGLLAVRAPAQADDSRSKGDNPPEVGVLRAAAESLTGDVYADPSRWRA